MTRQECLTRAAKIVGGARQEEYGTQENNFGVIAKLWNSYMGLGDYIKPTDVAMMMALLKIARIRTGTQTADSFVDLAGYAACGAEIATVKHG